MDHLLTELGISGGEEVFLYRCSYAMIVMSLLAAVLTMYIPGPYGRFASPAWGPAIGAQLSWVIQEAPSFLIPAALVMFTPCEQLASNTANRLITAAFMLHYFQRSFIYPCLIRGGKPTPLYTHLMALAVVVVNGYIQGRYHTQYAHYSGDYLYSVRMVCGLSLFLTGMFINLHSDHILRNLRRPGERGYKIPRGGMFQYVSCANYLGEIVEWGGYAVASSSLPALAFFILTASNLIPRAIAYHSNYRVKFDDYPRSRKAVIPFIL